MNTFDILLDVQPLINCVNNATIDVVVNMCPPTQKKLVVEYCAQPEAECIVRKSGTKNDIDPSTLLDSTHYSVSIASIDSHTSGNPIEVCDATLHLPAPIPLYGWGRWQIRSNF